jgi:hypothetical protein
MSPTKSRTQNTIILRHSVCCIPLSMTSQLFLAVFLPLFSRLLSLPSAISSSVFSSSFFLLLPLARISSHIYSYVLASHRYVPKNSKASSIFLSIPRPFLFPLCPFCSISLLSVLSPFRLHLVFFPVPFSSSLSFRYIHSAYVKLSLSPLSTFSPSFFSLFPGAPESPLSYTSHTSCCTWLL